MSDRDYTPRLLLLEGPDVTYESESEFEVPLGELLIGRDEDQDLVLTGSGVSRRHCRLVRRAGDADVGEAQSEVRIVDEGSHNGTFLNGRPVRESRVEHGDEILISGWRFLFIEAPSSRADQDADFESDSATKTRELEGHRSLYAAPESVVRGRPSEQLLEGLLRLTSLIGAVVSGESSIDSLRTLLVETFDADRCRLWLEDLDGDTERAGSPGWLRPGFVTPVPKLVKESDGGPGSALVAPLFEREPTTSSEARPQEPLPVGWLLLERERDRNRNWESDDLRAATVFAALMGPELCRFGRIQRRLKMSQVLATGDGLIGESAVMQSVKATVTKIAPTSAPVLLRGASGTGKEAVARAIHQLGDRSSGPFVAINCAAISPHLLESELFGHERGAFTGAVERRVGRLEAAHRGTLLLDEIGEMAPDLQAKLLRVLQDFRFERVGGKRTLEVDVRIVSATNRDLEERITSGAFRQDLYFRLNVVEIELPSLAERGADIDLLAFFFLNQLVQKVDRRVEGFDPSALEALRRYDWPGNVRELRNVVERALVLGHTERITREDLPDRLTDLPVSLPLEDEGFHMAVRQAKRAVIQEALERADHNVAAAARELKLSAPYLHRLLTRLDLRKR